MEKEAVMKGVYPRVYTLFHVRNVPSLAGRSFHHLHSSGCLPAFPWYLPLSHHPPQTVQPQEKPRTSPHHWDTRPTQVHEISVQLDEWVEP